jgi:ankyrin repeat protein
MREWLQRAQEGLDLPDAPEPYDGSLAPVYTCAAAGRKDAIDKLLAAGWDLNERDEGMRAALAFPEMREFLMERGARVDVSDCYGQTALFECVIRNRVDDAQTLLRLGADPNHQDQEGRTPLWIAANRKRLLLLQQLLKAGADPKLADASNCKKMALPYGFGNQGNAAE